MRTGAGKAAGAKSQGIRVMLLTGPPDSVSAIQTGTTALDDDLIAYGKAKSRPARFTVGLSNRLGADLGLVKNTARIDRLL
jgi:hypothetical protein